MIELILKTKDKKISGFEVSGHANYDDPGKDIVCSAVSMLTINTINTLEAVVKLKPNKEIYYKQEDDFISLDIALESLGEQGLRDTQIVMRSYELGMIDLLRAYQEFIEVYYEEV